MKFSQLMATPMGRIIRIVAGATLIAIGIAMKSSGGYVLAVVGALPLAAGIFDVCIFAPLFKMPFSGGAIRATKH